MEGAKSARSSYNWMMSTHFAANFLDALEVRPDYVHSGAVVADTFRNDGVGISPFKTRYITNNINNMYDTRQLTKKKLI